MRVIKLETARILFSSDVFAAVAVVGAKALSFFFLPKTYWFAWFPFPEQSLYTIGCTSELVLNSVLKPARVSIEGSRKICPLVLTCSIIRHSVPWVPEVIFLSTVYFTLGILRTNLWSQGSHSGKFLVVVVQ